MPKFVKFLLGTAVICGLLGTPSPTLADANGATKTSLDGRRHAIFTYYASLIAKLDATISFCDGARTGYRAEFGSVVTVYAQGIDPKVMPAYDNQYENFVIGLGDYSCPKNEVKHYRGRFARQIKNLERDIKALK